MKASKPVRGRVVARLNPVAGAVAVAVSSVAALPVQAQDRAIDEIVVTATRREAGVQDIPFNISAISGDQIDRDRINNIGDLARRVPGLQLVDQGPRNPSPLIVRGLTVNALTASEAEGNNNGGTVATYLGEIPVYIDLATRDIERVEVLRGPQGTLFGAGSLAGAVRYIVRQPDTQEFSAEIHGRGYGIDESDGVSYDIDGTVNIPLGENFAFRGTLSYLDQQGFIDQSYLVLEPGVSIPEPDFTNSGEVNANLRQEKDTNWYKRIYARASLLWDVNDRLATTFNYYYQNQDVGGRQINHADSLNVIAQDQGVEVPRGYTDNGHRVLEPDERTNHILNLDVVADLGFAELTSATGYIDFEENSQRDQTDLLLTFGYTYADFPNFTAFTTDPLTEETFTQEIRLVSTNDGPVNWIGGFFFRDQTQDQLSLEFTPNLYGFAGLPEVPQVIQRYGAFGDEIEYIQDQTIEFTEWALFGELGFQVTDRFEALVGVRWFEVESTFRSAIGFPLFNQALGIDPNDAANQIWLNESQASNTIDDVIFKLNASYQFMDDLLGYVTFSQGYRNGSTNGIIDCSQIPAPNPNVVCGTPDQLLYRPDTTDNYELGVRSQWLDQSVTLNAALYYIQWNDVQVATTSVSGGFPITVNGKSAESSGVEIDLNWQITDNFLMRTGYSFTAAKLAEEAPLLADGNARKGDRLPGSPEHQGSLFFDLNLPINAAVEFFGSYGFTAQSNVFTDIGTGSTCCRVDGAEELPGFTVHYLSVGVRGDQWEASLFADNLLNEQAVTGVRPPGGRTFIGRAGGAANYAFRRYFNYVITPRVVGLDLRYRF